MYTSQIYFVFLSMKPKRFILNIFVLTFVSIFDKTQCETSEYIYQSYQRSITCTSMFPPREPQSLSEIQDIVRYAIAQNVNVKPLGRQHSTTDGICTSGIPIKLSHISHFSYDLSSQLATAGAGIELDLFYEKLHQYNRGISGPPLYSGLSLGGAIANGAHGTGIKYPSTLSEQIVSVTFVDGRGNVRKITKDEEDFKAFRVNLGLLGIIYEFEIATMPQYKVHIRHFPVSDGIIWNGTDILEMVNLHDYFNFWWFPTNKQIILGVGNHAPVYVPGNCETRAITDISQIASTGFSSTIEAFQMAKDDIGLFHVQGFTKLTTYKDLPGREPYFVEEDGETSCLHGNTIGYSHRMLSNKCKECFWMGDARPLLNDDASIMIPLNKLMPALRTIGEILEKQLTQFALGGIWVRFLTMADGYLAMNEGGSDWAAIEWSTAQRWDKSKPKLGLSAYQAMGQVLIEQYGGRPHWGKNSLYYFSSQLIQKSHPDLDKFIAAMNKYDPQEIFMNTLGERVKYGKDRFTVAPDIAEHCALNELCVCRNNFDCGNEGLLDYTCGQFLGFPRYNVCLPSNLEQMKSSYSRTVINLLGTLEYNEDSVINYLGQYKTMKNILVRKKKKHLISGNNDITSSTVENDNDLTAE